MQVEAFDFDLPEDRIALRPARPRDAAKMLVVPPQGPFRDRRVHEAPACLEPGDLLIVNDTRVMPAALRAQRPPRDPAQSDAAVAVDVTLLERAGDDAWRAFARPAKRLRVGDPLHFAENLSATVAELGERGAVTLRFNHSGAALDAAVSTVGAPPLPPYIARRRPADDHDRDDYQTVYARHEGSVAAPTAGLHFTERLLAALDARGVRRAAITLHVGPGTFLPVAADDTEDHTMHAERCVVDDGACAAIAETRAVGGRIVAVGTTAMRSLEAASGEDGVTRPFDGATDLFITPGYRFRAVDVLMTNFHLPRSTLFMLVCAFSGTERMKAAYAHAVAHDYRFYSYGDACLLHRAAS